MTQGDVESVGTTLDGEELPPEEDPHYDDEDEDGGTSIYPIETTVAMSAVFDQHSRQPFQFTPAVRHPVDSQVPSARTSEVIESLSERFADTIPPVGEVGTVTITEDDHHIELDVDRQDGNTGPQPFSEWAVEMFYKTLSMDGDIEEVQGAGCSEEDLAELRENALSMLPGEIVECGGRCKKCGSEVREEVYLRPGQEKAPIMCDCGVGTGYPPIEGDRGD